MSKTRKYKIKKNISKCIYTDEAKKIMKALKDLRNKSKNNNNKSKNNKSKNKNITR